MLSKKIILYPLMAALMLGAWAMVPNSVQQAAAQVTEEDEERFRGRFTRIDTNANSVMTRAEYTIYRVSTFNRMDTNANGVLDLPEFCDQGRKPSERRAARRTRSFERIDQNGSGGVEREEWDGYADRRFVRMDADEDNEVSFAEFVTYVK